MNYRYRVGCSIENLKGVRDFIRKSLKAHHVPDLEISEMVLALDEMCSNLMIHAHHCNANDLFELRIIIDKDKIYIIFELVDDGTVFDINEICEPSIDNIVHQKRKGGLGIRLVKSIMVQIEYIASRGQTVCSLTKNITK